MGMGTVADLRQAAEWVADAANQGNRAEWMGPYRQLCAAAVEVGRAWCGSWLPRFSAHYDRDLLALPLHLRVQAAAAFDRLPPPLELSCRPWSAQEIRSAIRSRAGHPDEAGLQQGSATAAATLNDAIVAAVAALEAEAAQLPGDHRLAASLLAARQIEVTDAAIFVERCRPVAARQPGVSTAEPPPHLLELARLEALRSPFEALRQVAWLMRSAAVHLEQRRSAMQIPAPGAWLRSPTESSLSGFWPNPEDPVSAGATASGAQASELPQEVRER